MWKVYFEKWLVMVLLIGVVAAVGCTGTESIQVDKTNMVPVPVISDNTTTTALVVSTITLDGSGSYDREGDSSKLKYLWVFETVPDGSNYKNAVLGGTTGDAALKIARLTLDVAGSYKVSLSVSDGSLMSSPVYKTIRIKSSNTNPVAVVAAVLNATAGNPVPLNGTASSDADSGDELTFVWTLTARPAGSNATLINSKSATPSFTPDVVGDYTATLVVNDGIADSTPAAVTFTTSVSTGGSSNIAPVANAGPDQNTTVGSLVTLSGTISSDANGDAIKYVWTLTPASGSSATLTGVTTARPTFIPDIAGNYTATLIVNDGVVNSTADTVTITASTATNVTPTTINTENLLVSAISGKSFIIADSSANLYEVLEFGFLDTSSGKGTYRHIYKNIINTWSSTGTYWRTGIDPGYVRLIVKETPTMEMVMNQTGYMVEAATKVTATGYPKITGAPATSVESWIKVASLAPSDLSGHTLSLSDGSPYTKTYSFSSNTSGTYSDGFNTPRSFSWSIDAGGAKAVLNYADSSSTEYLYLTVRGLISGSREAGMIKLEPTGSVISGALNTWTYN